MRVDNNFIGVGIIISRVDYKGRRYIGPMVARKGRAGMRGWFLWSASQDEYSEIGGIHRICAWPDNGTRGIVGWPTRASAEAWARLVNGGPVSGAQGCTPFRESGLWQCRGFDAFGRHFNRSFRTVRDARLFCNAMKRGDNRVARY